MYPLFRRRAVYEVKMAGKAVPGEQAAFILAGPATQNLVSEGSNTLRWLDQRHFSDCQLLWSKHSASSRCSALTPGSLRIREPSARFFLRGVAFRDTVPLTR